MLTSFQLWQTPADDCWPSTSSWSTLNATVDGRLIHNQPIARPCYQGADYDAARCQEISADWADERWFSQFPTGYSYPTIETCPIINATLGPGRYPQCDLGNYPVYTVNASSTEHVAAGIRFARDNNIRLVIKNTGHDISQR